MDIIISYSLIIILLLILNKVLEFNTDQIPLKFKDEHTTSNLKIKPNFAKTIIAQTTKPYDILSKNNQLKTNIFNANKIASDIIKETGFKVDDTLLNFVKNIILKNHPNVSNKFEFKQKVSKNYYNNLQKNIKMIRKVCPYNTCSNKINFNNVFKNLPNKINKSNNFQLKKPEIKDTII